MRFSKSTITPLSKDSLNMTDSKNKSQNKLKYTYRNASGTILFTLPDYILAHIFLYVNPFDTIILLVAGFA